MSVDSERIGFSSLYPERRSNKSIVKTVLIYEDFASGNRGRLFSERLAGALDCRLEEKMWNFGVLGLREMRTISSNAARKADILIVSVCGNKSLPGTAQVWLEMVTSSLRKRKPALVGLFIFDPKRRLAPIHVYLADFAKQNGMDYFPHQAHFSVLEKSAPALGAKTIARANLHPDISVGDSLCGEQRIFLRGSSGSEGAFPIRY